VFWVISQPSNYSAQALPNATARFSRIERTIDPQSGSLNGPQVRI
jgi:hypothetical protein